jgi:hypothetical protein
MYGRTDSAPLLMVYQDFTITSLTICIAYMLHRYKSPSEVFAALPSNDVTHIQRFRGSYLISAEIFENMLTSKVSARETFPVLQWRSMIPRYSPSLSSINAHALHKTKMP